MAREHWTDERIDGLADNVYNLTGSIRELRESISELRESVRDTRESVDGLRVTSQALLQIAAQHQQEMELIKERQAESDARFNVLLEEVRYLIRRERDD